jgi:hypothetical protein
LLLLFWYVKNIATAASLSYFFALLFLVLCVRSFSLCSETESRHFDRQDKISVSLSLCTKFEPECTRILSSFFGFSERSEGTICNAERERERFSSAVAESWTSNSRSNAREDIVISLCTVGHKQVVCALCTCFRSKGTDAVGLLAGCFVAEISTILCFTCLREDCVMNVATCYRGLRGSGEAHYLHSVSKLGCFFPCQFMITSSVSN